ncbi:hypothetical protein [Jannaschia sp. LMIT008]|uniref:hypothetical protein n=1 Tax=Jannaschia maritima TaxID=3032585 RepID=UPI002811E9D6|nr:hypothetical protein [Jannaschia sp. LMIT008]
MSKRREERIKLTATSINTVGLGFLGFAVIRPLSEETFPSVVGCLFLTVAFALHLIAHYVLRYMDEGDGR